MCTNCDPNSQVSSYTFPYNSPCTNCDSGECPQGIAPASCLYYDGPPLACIGSDTNERLSLLFQKIDAKICVFNPESYSTYNTYCLAPVNTQKEFVEKISQQFCTLKSSYETFTVSTFPTAISTINSTITTLNTPNVTSCTQIGFTPSDTIRDSLQKLSNSVCDIYNNQLSVSGVTWSQCAVVPTPPTTIIGGFNFVVSQLCNLASQISGSVTLPTFDNTGSCLSSPTSTDSLESTVIKIRSRLCTTPAFNINSLTWNCIAQPSSTATDLQSAFQAVLTKIDSISQNLPIFDPSDFVTNNTNPSQPCAGKTISLQSPIAASDRFVAVNNADSSPGTLVQKLTPGTGITLDTTTTPGTMIISSTSVVDDKVKTSVTDPSAGYLEDKITGSTGTVNITTNTVSNEVVVSASVNYTLLVQNIIDAITADPTLKEQFCSLIVSCPSPCAAPTNLTVTYVP